MDFDDLPDGVLVADAGGIITYVNTALLRLARIPRAMLVGRPLVEGLPFDDLAGRTWVETVDPYGGLATRTRISEQSWWSPRGNEYLVTGSILREKPGGAVREVIVMMRSARIRNRRERERSDLVATVAHELRSPLTGIKGFSSTLLTKWDKFNDEQRHFMLETVDADADRLSRLITELLDAARIDAGRLTLHRGPVRLDDVVRHVLTVTSAGSGHPFELTIRDDVPTIWGDKDRIIQVVTNLVENALRHGDGLKHVLVQRTRRQGYTDGVTLQIHDNGPGISEDIRGRVFGRFWKSGPGAGSGLGMYIVKGIVDEHEGLIDIIGAEEGGANIRVWFPINEPASLSE